jgi:hypothetical protein
MTTALATARPLPTVGATEMTRYVKNAVADLADAISQYPALRVYLQIAHGGLAAALARADREETPRAQFHVLRGAAAVASGTLADLRLRHPELENTSSLICDVAYALNDITKLNLQPEVR